ncbi:hypothetical protein HETIRDRAFT_416203 [Heterobasidion irregulare TC 32-1]|uniref:Uncharacterized protein n=1 Tax=Heterobasidion irregulare (strain TC 32-1) TaxID=747525 RepID=W4KFA1_HETIT|nr:uncharacterized protein HETIRDRAFT_416203 [Heterobasidion irregulare TC 32-1]ETW84518.1 hypothetical protein HETIRDRAFT_416203 [Heterobasidion irregulare TC 32-1]
MCRRCSACCCTGRAGGAAPARRCTYTLVLEATHARWEAPLHIGLRGRTKPSGEGGFCRTPHRWDGRFDTDLRLVPHI